MFTNVNIDQILSKGNSKPIRNIKFNISSSIVLSILSAYDVNNMHELIINSIDDLLWVRLSQIVFPSQDLMTLTKLQKLVYNEGSQLNEEIIFENSFFHRWNSKFIQ